MKNYFFDTQEDIREDKVYVLIIYDISDNKKRVKLSKHLQGYGFRIQKSAFEAMIKPALYRKLKKELEQYVDRKTEDNIRIYKIIGQGQVTVLGKQEELSQKDVVII